MMMHGAMRLDMVYEYPIWSVGLLMVALAIVSTSALEIAARRYLPRDFRRQHNDIAAAILAIIGVTYAVLLAFIAMLAWDGYNSAKASSSREAAALADVNLAAQSLDASARAMIRSQLIAYATTVVNVEWPSQASGKIILPGDAKIDEMTALAANLPATGSGADARSQVQQAIGKLNDARAERLLAAESSTPGIVWLVVCIGGALTIIVAACLGAPNVAMQLAMGAGLAVSGVLVLIMIIALSNPFRGDFRVSAAPYERVLARLGHAPQ